MKKIAITVLFLLVTLPAYCWATVQWEYAELRHEWSITSIGRSSLSNGGFYWVEPGMSKEGKLLGAMSDLKGAFVMATDGKGLDNLDSESLKPISFTTLNRETVVFNPLEAISHFKSTKAKAPVILNEFMRFVFSNLPMKSKMIPVEESN